MAWDGADVLRDFRRMRRAYERGEETQLKRVAINAVIDLLEALQELVRFEVKRLDPEQPDREAYAASYAAIDAVLPEKYRRAASALRQEGVENWATFLPGFEDAFPNEEEPKDPGTQSETNDD